ncbi:MAG: alanine racemase [Candidatus Schekmanbacteria bacterium]|nr:alanine racemase [Candidatus Schekmanbacteria bacterium]
MSTAILREVPERASSWVEISATALRHNLGEFRRIIGPRCGLMAVVKSNAYGHGLAIVAGEAAAAGVEALGVNTVDEGLTLRRAGIDTRIVVLGYLTPAAMAEAVAARLEPTVYQMEAIASARTAAAAARTRARLHLKVETGTHRQGVSEAELISVSRAITADPHLELAGLSTHFANIEDTTDHTYARQQLACYEALVRRLADHGIVPGIRHIACSAAAILLSETHQDMARVGIGLYGLWPSKETYLSSLLQAGMRVDLVPVMALKARIAQVKDVPAGAYVGYGLTYRATHPTRLAVLPIGYYEGYDRGLSNLAHVLVHGVRAPVRGRICMNICMVDVTDVPAAAVNDEVVLLGAQGDERVRAEDLARHIGTINYEIVARIHPDLPRVLVA